MSEVDKSIKLVFNEFQRSISEVPLEVYYQTINADQYNSNGFQFNIKAPGTKALLDTDVWLAYDFKLQETANDTFKNSFIGNARDAVLFRYPAVDTKTALRSGFVVQKATQSLSIQINNTTLNVRPCQWLDVLNRLYISNDQSEHEFCTSGGRFDEGNHGFRTQNMRYEPAADNALLDTSATSFSPQVPNAYTFQPQQAHTIQILAANNVADGGVIAAGNAAAGTNSQIQGNIVDGWFTPNLPANTGFKLYMLLQRPIPLSTEFWNPGFDQRVGQLAKKIRLLNASNALTAVQFGARAAQASYQITVFERLAIPLFKMYSNDEIFGVIPNITQMQIQGNFLSNFLQNIVMTNDPASLQMDWNLIAGANCRIYLRWYTPPMSMMIPRELSVPYKKIVTWSKTAELLLGGMAGLAAADNFMTAGDVTEYNISLEGIPDLLLIYMKWSASLMSARNPDDFNLELTNLMINIDNASGKVNQINSLDLYNKWKKLLKHSDNKIIGYDEWRKYCCVAALQPEDYGVRYGPGYSNPCVLGLKFTPISWWRNPAIGPFAQGGQENFGGNAGADINTELVVTTIYYKNRLIIRADGTAQQEMVKIAADFDMTRPDVGMGGMGASGYGVQNA